MSEPTSPSFDAVSAALVLEIARLTRVARRLETQSEHQDSELLLLLETHGALTLDDLARHSPRPAMMIRTSAVELAERGLIRRGTLGTVEISPAGRASLDDTRAQWSALTAERLRSHGGFTPAEVGRAAEVLRALLQIEGEP